ncbi:MAG: RidA family protein [Flavobacteriales bacterium]|nr:RidA family protein [Flavobacteriales bacterium]
MERQIISSSDFWEGMTGQSRAVRAGNIIEVSATSAINQDGEIVGGKNIFQQTFFIVEKIEMALKAEGASLSDVIRTRVYVTDISEWEEVAKALHHFFADVKPASSMVEVSALIDRRMLIEIEATAVIG